MHRGASGYLQKPAAVLTITSRFSGQEQEENGVLRTRPTGRRHGGGDLSAGHCVSQKSRLYICKICILQKGFLLTGGLFGLTGIGKLAP